jgi:hypothetical protein
MAQLRGDVLHLFEPIRELTYNDVIATGAGRYQNRLNRFIL